MKNILLSLLVFTASTAAISAYAQHADTDSSSQHEQALDLSDADFGIGHFDSNHDGNISLQEYLAGDPANTERVYQHLDANSDGLLDRQEQMEIEAVYKQLHEQMQVKNNTI